MRKSVILLLAIGLLQMVGDLIHVPAIKGVAAATVASPAPRVFSAAHGLETYSTRFFVEWTDKSGARHSEEITPRRAAGLRGAYNRRNVFGAVLAYGPVMQADPMLRPMFDSVARYALCGRAPLLEELGIDPRTLQGPPRVRLEPRPGSKTGDLPLSFEAACQ